mgnify:CR=1 FL=1
MICTIALPAKVDSARVIAEARELTIYGRVHDAAVVLDRFLLRNPQSRKVRRILTGLRKRFLLIDNDNDLFDTSGMQRFEFSSDYNQIRFYSLILTQYLPADMRSDRLMEQQVSEIVKNAIKHGNRGNILKKIRVWFECADRVRYVIEDEGSGMQNMEEWNDFNRRRRKALRENDMEQMFSLLAYKGEHSEENDGGNSLFAALEFWDEGMLYSSKRNKVVVVKYRS